MPNSKQQNQQVFGKTLKWKSCEKLEERVWNLKIAVLTSIIKWKWTNVKWRYVRGIKQEILWIESGIATFKYGKQNTKWGIASD